MSQNDYDFSHKPEETDQKDLYMEEKEKGDIETLTDKSNGKSNISTTNKIAKDKFDSKFIKIIHIFTNQEQARSLTVYFYY